VKPGRWLADRLGLGPVWAEVIKQAIDQPLHVAMGVASVHVFGVPLVLLEVPVWAATVIAVLWTLAWEGLRELSQGWSTRPWDPPLDYVCELGGVVLGAWLLYSNFS
jgi:hypothetical protein